VRLFAAETVPCGDVVLQDELPVLLLCVQEYQLPPVTSCIFTVPAAAGVSVKVTESMLPDSSR
jgi:hypothetical protein